MRLVAGSLAAFGLVGCNEPFVDNSGTPTSTSDATSSTGAADTTSTSTSSSTGDPAGDVEAEITLFPEQPMVVDIALSLGEVGTATLVHTTDMGVRITEQPGGGPRLAKFRVRGLQPAMLHTLRYDVVLDGDAGTWTGEIDVSTGPPLTDYVAAFALETTDVDPTPGYRLFDASRFPIGVQAGAFMVDTSGVTRWYLTGPTDFLGPPSVWVALRLRADGTLLYVQENTLWIRDEVGNVLTEIPSVELGFPTMHHEVLELPSGNFMTLCEDFREVEYADLGTVWVVGDVIVELTPDGSVVWEWHAFDHLDPQRRREGFEELIENPVTGIWARDWTHANAIEPDATGQTLLLSMRHQDWIIAIDRGSGEVLWRLGDEGDFTLPMDQRWFFHQHAPEWQPDGTILLYDNGNGNPAVPLAEVHSRAMRIAIDPRAMTADIAWQDDEPFFQAIFGGDADRIVDGRYLVTDAAIFGDQGSVGRIREVDPERSPTRVWTLSTPPGRWAYRSRAYDRLVGEPAPAGP